MKTARGVAMILVCLSVPVMADRFRITPAVVSGDSAPGGGTFSTIDKHAFIFNKSGQLLFLGKANESASGLFLYDGANQQLVARTGMQAAGMPAGTNYTYFADLSLATSGQVAFTGHSSQGEAIWAGPVNELQLAAKAGAAVPGNPLLTFGSGFGHVSINSAGQVAFNQGDWDLTGSNRAVWSGMPGAIGLVAADGQAAPGTNTTFYDVTPMDLSETGEVVFLALTNPFIFDKEHHTGIWAGRPGSLERVAADGVEAPDTGGLSWDYGGFHAPSINASGMIVVRGSLGHTSDNDGIWTGRPGDLKLVLRDGQDAPGTNAKFTGNWAPILNDAGQIAVRGTITGHQTSGIWTGTAEDLRLVLLEGDAVPGTCSGATINSVNWNLLLNNKGQVAFVASLSTRNAHGNPTSAIFATQADGDLLLVAQEGGFLNVHGVQKRIDELFLHGQIHDDSRFTDDGVFAFYAKFTDGSEGIFYASNPEPTAIALLPVVALFLARRRRLPRG